jgi:hypothetical protein
VTTSLVLQCDGANLVPTCAASACTSALLWTKWRVDWIGRQQRSTGSKRVCQRSLHEGRDMCVRYVANEGEAHRA